MSKRTNAERETRNAKRETLAERSLGGFLRAQLPLSALCGHAVRTSAATLVADLRERDEVRAVLTIGARAGVLSAANPWLLATDVSAARELLSRVDAVALEGLQLDWRLRGALGERRVARELFATWRRPRRGCAPRPDPSVLRLDEVVVRGLPLGEDVRRVVGDPGDFAPGAPFWCLVREGQVVAVAETIARFARHVAVQQVYTSLEHRGRGHAHALLRHVLRSHAPGTTFVWITSPENVASRRLARSLGFRRALDLACS